MTKAFHVKCNNVSSCWTDHQREHKAFNVKCNNVRARSSKSGNVLASYSLEVPIKNVHFTNDASLTFSLQELGRFQGCSINTRIMSSGRIVPFQVLCLHLQAWSNGTLHFGTHNIMQNQKYVIVTWKRFERKIGIASHVRNTCRPDFPPWSGGAGFRI